MCRWAGKNMTNGTSTQSCTPRRRRGRSTAAGAGAAGAHRHHEQGPGTSRRRPAGQGAPGWEKMAVMTSDTDTVALLERVLDQTAGLIAAIEPGQAGLATPCAATGQQLAGLDPALAEHALNWSRGMLRPEF